MSEDAYSREKMAATIDVLATGTASLQQRLRDAYVSGVGRLSPDDIKVEPDAVEPLERIKVALTRLSAPQTGSVTASTAAMDDETARDLARDCLELYCRVFRIWER